MPEANITKHTKDVICGVCPILHQNAKNRNLFMTNPPFQDFYVASTTCDPLVSSFGADPIFSAY